MRSLFARKYGTCKPVFSGVSYHSDRKMFISITVTYQSGIPFFLKWRLGIVLYKSFISINFQIFEMGHDTIYRYIYCMIVREIWRFISFIPYDFSWEKIFIFPSQSYNHAMNCLLYQTTGENKNTFNCFLCNSRKAIMKWIFSGFFLLLCQFSDVDRIYNNIFIRFINYVSLITLYAHPWNFSFNH